MKKAIFISSTFDDLKESQAQNLGAVGKIRC